MTYALPDASCVLLHCDLKATMTIRKGSIEQRSRGDHVRPLSFKVSKGHDVLRAKLIRLFEEDTAEQQLVINDDCVYFRKSKGQLNSFFAIISDETFESYLGQSWKRISAGDRTSWDSDVVGNFQFEFFLYCSSHVPPPAPSFHRATAARIRVAAAAVQQFQQENDMTLGPITTSHLVTTQAHQSDINSVSLPSNNTTMQAMELDAVMQQCGGGDEE